MVEIILPNINVTNVPKPDFNTIRALTADDITFIIMAWIGLWGWYRYGDLNDRQRKVLMYFNMIGFPLLIGIYTLIMILRVKAFG